MGKTFPEQALGGGSLEAVSSQFRLQSPIDGKERLVAARRLAHYPLSLRMTTTVEEALSDWY
ncbi:MAG: hypothetical protein JWR49_3883 [Tardiphaga sp.]|nr:hypothetical protein [Tardiphaga sp.]